MAADALVRHVVTFGRVLREAGLQAGPGRVADALAGLDAVQLADRDQVYWALRTTLVSRREEIEPFDRAFQAWFLRSPLAAASRDAERPQRTQEGPPGAAGREQSAPKPADAADADRTEVGWSMHEVLRRKDFATMTPEELALLRRALRDVASARPLRATRRLRRHPQGDRLDLRALVRSSLGTGGEPIERTWKRRTLVPRKLVVIADVSGSMEAYTRVLFMFLHAVVGAGKGVEAFVFGTRLTRLTDELRGGIPTRPCAAPPSTCSTRPRGRGSAPRSSSTTTSGGGGRSRAARSPSSSPTAGSATIPASSDARWHGSHGRPMRSSG